MYIYPYISNIEVDLNTSLTIKNNYTNINPNISKLEQNRSNFKHSTTTPANFFKDQKRCPYAPDMSSASEANCDASR